MGKASRLKGQRAAEREAKPFGLVGDLTEAIGYLYGSSQDCAAATAQLIMASEALGISLEPMPVSVVVTQPSSNTVGFMGPRASARMSESERRRVEDHRRNGGDPGHLVAVMREPTSLLLDPNLGQLRSFGVDSPSFLVLEIPAEMEADAEWGASLPDLDLTYMPDGNDALWERYEEARRQLQADSERLAEHFRRGGSLAQIKSTMQPRK